MDKNALIRVLQAHEGELRTAGVESLSVFGSAARGEAGPRSDIDVLVRMRDGSAAGLEYFRRLDLLGRRLEEILGRPVDIVTEPVRKDRLRQRIERDRIRAF
jgi:predicted nucleotidyltransferase